MWQKVRWEDDLPAHPNFRLILRRHLWQHTTKADINFSPPLRDGLPRQRPAMLSGAGPSPQTWESISAHSQDFLQVC